jgi:molybdopterin-guanine dinucleotide biosynthesis protein A
MPQPALCLLHQEIAPFVSEAILRSEFKLFPVLVGAAKALAIRDGVDVDAVLLNRPWRGEVTVFDGEAQWAARHLWFANLNTPEEFRAAEASAGLLELD